MNGKKIFLLSEEGDVTSNKVISYLSDVHQCKIERLNFDLKFDDKNRDENILTMLYTFVDNISSYSSFWLRRGNFPDIKLTSKEKFLEYHIYRRYLHYLIEYKPNSLGSLVKEYDHNKLIDLKKAEDCGLKVPSSKLIYNSQSALNFIKDNNNTFYITKALNDPIRKEYEGYAIYGGFTSKVLEEELKFDQFIFPSIIQEKIEKKYEIRSFYIKGTFYSMAIFSQKDSQTAIDFRHYNKEKPNRNVPFKLPDYIEGKLTNLMEKLELNTGSIDLIYSTNNEFIFLEVNPCGQFDWLSENCNYFIERHIAKVLKDG